MVPYSSRVIDLLGATTRMSSYIRIQDGYDKVTKHYTIFAEK